MTEPLAKYDLSPSPKPKGGARLWWVLGAILVLGAGAAWYYFANRAAAPGDAKNPDAGATVGGVPGVPGSMSVGTGAPRKGGPGGGGPLPVTAATIRTGDVNIVLTALGTVIPKNNVTVRSRVDGQLAAIRFKEGETVKAGDVLAEIDPKPLEVALAQAQGQMAKDQALLKNAEVDYERYKTLLAQDSIAAQQVETQASLVRQSQGTVQADQAQVDSAKLQLSYTRVVAPISGRLGLRQVDPGNMIRSSDTTGLVVITQVQPITVTYAIPQDSLQAILKRIASGDKMQVEAWDREGKKKLATGVLLTLDNQIDTATGTIKLKAEFPNADNALFPNQFVNVRMRLDTLTGVTIAPTSAIQRGSPGTFVYLVKDDSTVTLRTVKLGVTEGDNVAVESGLAPGDKVVVDGGDKLREGAKVEVVVRENLDTPRKGRPGGAGKGGDGTKQWKKDGSAPKDGPAQPRDAAPAKDAKAAS
jgi:multidrug efflux system membrane fusion protein